MILEITETRRRVKCTVCGNYTFRVSYKTQGHFNLVGYYCQHCKTLYPKKGIRPGTDKLYLGLNQVSS